MKTTFHADDAQRPRFRAYRDVMKAHGGSRSWLSTALLALVTAVGLAACSSGGGHASTASTSTTQASTVSPGSGSTATLPKATASTARRWCALKLGAREAVVRAAMGAPHGSNAASYKTVFPRGTRSLEWDDDSVVFVASFTNGRATTLQAYDRLVGPVVGARGLPCAAFRRA